MAQYVVLIYENEKAFFDGGEQVWQEVMEAHNKFAETAGDSIAGGNALQPTSAATSIRQDSDGTFAVTDAPFAEAKEALGGYYIIEAPDLDAAIELAKRVPAKFGGVEVRPVMVFD